MIATPRDFFLTVLIEWARADQRLVQDRLDRLMAQLAAGEIDVDTYLRIRSRMDMEQAANRADERRWCGARDFNTRRPA